MGRKFTQRLTPAELAAKVADRIVADEDYDPNDPDCYGNPRDTYSDDIAFLKAADYAMHCCLAYLTPQVRKDLSKVEFDDENLAWQPGEAYCKADDICGFRTLPNGLTILGATAGGDWEMPIYFCIYWDGTKLRGYVPKDGNTWNHKRKQAFGNGSDEAVEKKEFMAQTGLSGYGEYNVDCDRIVADIMGRITEA